MRATKELTSIAVMVALLIGGQFILSFAVGIEIVTVLLCSYCMVFGAKRGFVVALAFVLLRTLIFGFYLTTFILYIVYYPLFAIIIGSFGIYYNKKIELINKNKKIILFIILVILVCVLTCCFTLLDDLITPLIMGFSKSSINKYFLASLPIMVTQIICSAITCSILFIPLYKLLNKIKQSQNKNLSTI